VKPDDRLEFARPLPSTAEAPDKPAGGVEYHHFAGTCVRDDDSTIGEESGTPHALKRDLVPATHDRPRSHGNFRNRLYPPAL